MMKLISITNDFSVDPDEVAALEKYEHWKNADSPSGDSSLDHEGTIVIQKNGRKSYIRGLTVKQIMDKLKPPTPTGDSSNETR